MIQKVISGSKGGSKKPHNPVEMEDNLISINKIKILLAVSDGEIDETFSLKQLMFNSVPVQNEDGSFNFEGVKAEFRPGTQTQEYIKGMEDSSSEVTVNREVTTDNPYTIDRKSTRLNSSHVSISYAVFCLKKKKKIK